MSYNKRKIDAFHTELIDTKTGKSNIVHTADLEDVNNYKRKRCIHEDD